MIVGARSAPMAEAGGHPLASLRAATKLGVLTLMLTAMSGAPAARAVEAVNVPTRGQPSELTVDLTGAVDFQHSDSDRVQVNTAAGPDGIVRRIEVRAREADSNWGIRAGQQRRSANRPAHRRAALPHGGLRTALA